MHWLLILYFTCGWGCGEPVSVELPFAYTTWEDCTAAGKVFLSPAANPTHTVARFSCNPVERPQTQPRHNDRWQE